ncbi:MAG: 4Fe-4S dicluster domain-containing protein [Defluviitaleaceae bacterium]|nr:4Fe-4S dicluster domain-containing protein [Defluviitaleaceae bacterium]MCL2273495.1 4Fe-4S dicluster domain-containing protein [Defluviitaleaceae bacterium]
MAVLTFNDVTCKGCDLCVDACPKKILTLDTSRVNAKGYNPVLCTDINACTACAICARVCPDSVIKVEKGEAA